MKKIVYLMSIGLLGVLFSCEKDETKATMLENPIVPNFQTVPDLTLLRANGLDTLTFTASPLDAGFKASTKYFLEACATGTNFTDPVTLYSDVQCETMKITVSDLNGQLLKKFPADQTSTIDLRIRVLMVTDGGTGAKTFSYTSDIKTVDATIYGLPRLDVMDGSTVVGKVESPLGNGQYSGFVKFDAAKAYTLVDPDNGTVYGGAGGVLAVNGAEIAGPGSGYYKTNVNTQALTYSTSSYMIGLVGDATPNAWNSPDTKMDYNPANGTWYITLDLIDGFIKFRLNDGWAWNLGGALTGLTQGGDNIPVTAGNYTITLTINADGQTGSATVVKN
jgi:hypothetical protein